jgi:hypothetical protein
MFSRRGFGSLFCNRIILKNKLVRGQGGKVKRSFGSQYRIIDLLVRIKAYRPMNYLMRILVVLGSLKLFI